MYKILFPKSVNYKGKQYLTAVSDKVQNYLHHKMVKNDQVVYIHSKQCTMVTEMDQNIVEIRRFEIS